MPRVLILSSHVAASRVGGRVAVSALEARGIDTVFVPTVLLGRHPGHGAPGGGAVPAEQFGSMLDGIAAQGLFAGFDAVLTGYFASVEQVEITAAAILDIRKASPHPLIIIDPVIGDDGQLYVPEEVAIAIRDQLLPLASLITPNAFELGWLSGETITSAQDFKAAAHRLAPITFMTSARFEGLFGTACHANGEATFAAHIELDILPHGTGDLMTAELLAELVTGTPPGTAFETAVRNTLDVALKARDGAALELPDISARHHPLHPDAMIDLHPLKG